MATNYLPPEIYELKKFLMGNPDFLGMRQVKSVWDDLTKCVSKKNDNVTNAFDKLEKTIQDHFGTQAKKLHVTKRNTYSNLKVKIIAACKAEEKNNGYPRGQSLEARGQHVKKVQVNKQTTLPQKEDNSASMAFTRVCQLIEWLYGVFNDRTDVQPPDIQKHTQLNDEHTLPYNEAEMQIFEIRGKFKELTNNQEKNTLSTAVTPFSQTETASTELETPFKQRENDQDKQTSAGKPVIESDRKYYDEIVKNLQKNMHQQNAKFEEKIQILKRELRSLKEEKEGLMTRMSKMAGDKLTHNNPAITDLSDPNRPQKIAEKYGELYDNEWTDAIDKLNPQKEEKNDRQCIDVLSAILKFCYSECEKIADSQLSQLETDCTIIQFPSKHQGKLPEGSEAIKRHLLDAQHSASSFTMRETIDFVNTRLVRDKKLNGNAKRIPQYTTKCIEICWSMVTHHPRLFLMWPDVRKETTIRQDMFQAYTRSGDTLDFVVWPAMLLFDDGPLLRKGTVQPVAR